MPHSLHRYDFHHAALLTELAFHAHGNALAALRNEYQNSADS
ncbi:Uncharacterised protein [Vibrio cholerae]|nr:Uncharacterised protein [Vibrio cholerae]